MTSLDTLSPGMAIPYGGDKVVHVSETLARSFRAGDRLIVVQTTGDLIHIPSDVWAKASNAVEQASTAFGELASVKDSAISAFFEGFAARLESSDTFAPIASANATDVSKAKGKGRSVTRLLLTDTMRAEMIQGLRTWRDTQDQRGQVVETIEHDGWRLDQITAGLGLVGFVFEGRPNVFADATGVLRSGNTVAFRIGSDALGTAKAIIKHALRPALAEAGLPLGSVSLVDSPSRAAGHAMFSDSRLALAVARGSGTAVAQLGSVARQAGIPVSLHGTGGAWIITGRYAQPERFTSAIYHSLDRKVCNTLNTCCILREHTDSLIPLFLESLDSAGQRRGSISKLHVLDCDRNLIPEFWFDHVTITRSEGDSDEPRASLITRSELGVEWEWEESPEVSLAIVDSVAEAVNLFNNTSPNFIASLISESSTEQTDFYNSINAPFVGNGFTRWVDGQYALEKPELGLSNWEFGRLFGRGGVLSGDSVYTVRSRATQTNPNLRR